MTIHLKHGDCLEYNELPLGCVEDCSHVGECYDDCKAWVKRIPFIVERTDALQYLKESGAYDGTELDKMSNNELAIRILWFACCEMRDEMNEGNKQPTFYMG